METASAVGIITNPEHDVMAGKDFEELKTVQQDQALDSIRVLHDCTWQSKVAVVSRLKAHGRLVAYLAYSVSCVSAMKVKTHGKNKQENMMRDFFLCSFV